MMTDTLRLYLGAAKLAAIALAILAAVWWWDRHNAAQQDIGYRRAAGEYAEKLAAAQLDAQRKERRFNEQWEQAQNARMQTEIQLDRARAAAGAADRRLQQSTRPVQQRISAAGSSS